MSSPTVKLHVRQPSQSLRIFEDGIGYLRKVGSSFDVHGRHTLPPGYRWVIPSPILCADLVRGLQARESIHISRSRSFVKMVTSIVQLVLSSVTIYRSRGSQLDRYGYAAFGLTVIPYTFMSLVNFIYVGVVGEYAALTILRTSTMEEANGRLPVEGRICGDVGTLAPTSPAYPGHEGSAGGVDEIAKVVDEILANAKDGTDDSNKFTISLWTEGNILCVKKRDADQIRKFRLIEVGEPNLLFDVHPIASHLRVREPKTDREDTILPNIGVDEVLKERFNRANRLHKLSLTVKAFIVVAAPLLAVILPPVLIATWTGYHYGQGSLFRRIVMVSWLTLNQFAVLAAQLNLLAKYKSAWKHKVKFRSSLRESVGGAQTSDDNGSGENPGPITTHNNDTGGCGAFFILCCGSVLVLVEVTLRVLLLVLTVVVPVGIIVVVLGLPIAGFVEVGKMLKEFGTCTVDS